MSTEPKLTPWFPADVKPARNGVYECRWRYGIWITCRGCVDALLTILRATTPAERRALASRT